MEGLRNIVREQIGLILNEEISQEDLRIMQNYSDNLERKKHNAYQTLYSAIEYIRTHAMDLDDYDPLEVLIGVYDILNKWEIEEG